MLLLNIHFFFSQSVIDETLLVYLDTSYLSTTTFFLHFSNMSPTYSFVLALLGLLITVSNLISAQSHYKLVLEEIQRYHECAMPKLTSEQKSAMSELRQKLKRKFGPKPVMKISGQDLDTAVSEYLKELGSGNYRQDYDRLVKGSCNTVKTYYASSLSAYYREVLRNLGFIVFLEMHKDTFNWIQSSIICLALEKQSDPNCVESTPTTDTRTNREKDNTRTKPDETSSQLVSEFSYADHVLRSMGYSTKVTMKPLPGA